MDLRPLNDNDEYTVVYSEESSYYSAWKTADALEEQLHNSDAYQETTIQVIHVLREWGRLYAGELTSFLRKTPLLLHETQESIVALHYLREWWKAQTSSNALPEFIVLDICCGKGYFAMFLRYLVTLFWNEEDEGTGRPKLKQIIMFDKATNSDINWDHIGVANASAIANADTDPHLELWPGTNIHDYDNLVDKLLSYKVPLALTGIHLCKMLSPAFISLVNGLGKECHYTCLAPCCVPRSVTKGNRTSSITVNQYETELERLQRKEYIAQRQAPRPCHCCGSLDHLARQCHVINDKSVAIRGATPCWTCGKMGHFSNACPTPSVRKPSVSPPMLHVDATHVAQSSDPFETYCQLLAEMQSRYKKVMVHNAGLTTLKNKQQEQQHHWNASRKCIFIVATKCIESPDAF